MNSDFKIIQYLPLTRARATRRFLNKLDKNSVQAILDLEDSAQDPFDIKRTNVLKKEARDGLLKISESFDNSFKSNIFIRINAMNSHYFDDDIHTVIASAKKGMPITGIFLPKTENHESIFELVKLFRRESIDLEIVPMIETKKGYENLSKILLNEKGLDLFSKVHYGHFDYCLDSELWPFPDPYHTEYWNIITPIMDLLEEHGKTYIHTPFPFPDDKDLFWSSQGHIYDLKPNLEFWACTLNLELSLSKDPQNLKKMELIEINHNQDYQADEAKIIIEDYYNGRASKRSFGMSSSRFIPPHQVFAAQEYLKRISK